MPRKADFYVYRIFDGFETVYVGKGSGRRLAAQKRKFGCDGEIIEACKSDDHAFKREIYWIEQLKPSENKNPGGLGGRVKPKRVKIDRAWAAFERELKEVGPRRYVARFLAQKLDHNICEQYGVSQSSMAGILAVAHGAYC